MLHAFTLPPALFRLLLASFPPLIAMQADRGRPWADHFWLKVRKKGLGRRERLHAGSHSLFAAQPLDLPVMFVQKHKTETERNGSHLLACILALVASLQANLWIAIFSFIGNYFWTHYFYRLLGASYTFPSWRLNDVRARVCMRLMLHSINPPVA